MKFDETTPYPSDKHVNFITCKVTLSIFLFLKCVFRLEISFPEISFLFLNFEISSSGRKRVENSKYPNNMNF